MSQRCSARWVKIGGAIPAQGLCVVACTLDTGAAHRKTCLGLARFSRGRWTLLQVYTPDWCRWSDARLTHWLDAYTPNSVDGPVVKRLGEPTPELDDERALPVTLNMPEIKRCWRAHLKAVNKTDV